MTPVHFRFPSHRSQQARNVHLMLGKRWASVVDGAPTVTQHWVNVSCLLDCIYQSPLLSRPLREISLTQTHQNDLFF